ncbi:hypothetical protein [Yinghuangia seranimata]|uniref:hypothetical protein n=1 Tax=Yinghuangia seranimata TaxID=408067 RepID=UPI00248C236E|nr:hypothetical protein [Yinghuangia seranimata]MDI2129468.1 hypothetical protein [Yinghuangia seranimata]
MSHAVHNRRRRSARVFTTGPVSRLLSLPARLHLRWLVILVVTAVVMGFYISILVTAPPMPPGKAPATVGGEPGLSTSPAKITRR